MNTQPKSLNLPTPSWQITNQAQSIGYKGHVQHWQFADSKLLTLVNLAICLLPLIASMTLIQASLLQLGYFIYCLILWWYLVVNAPSCTLSLRFDENLQAFVVNNQLAHFEFVSSKLLLVSITRENSNTDKQFWLSQDALLSTSNNAWRALLLRIAASQGRLL